MRVVVYAQDLSGRNDDGYYTKPDLASALDIFFNAREVAFLDADGEDALSREDAEEMFRQERRVAFYNEAGEKVVISSDATA